MRSSSHALSLSIALLALACDDSEPTQRTDASGTADVEIEHDSSQSPDPEADADEPKQDAARTDDAAQTDADEDEADDATLGTHDDAAAPVIDAGPELDGDNDTAIIDDADAAQHDAFVTDAAPSTEPDAESPDAGTTDACGAACDPAFVPVRFSSTDRSACSVVANTGFEVELTDWGPCGVRSDGAIEPGSGVFYVEALRFTPRYRGGGFGLATAQVPLIERIGASAQSLGVIGTGELEHTGTSCTGSTMLDSLQPELGVVVDYRGTSPLVHFFQPAGDGSASLRASCSMTVTTPVFVFYSGDRAKVGPELRINTGADTTNFPFRFSQEQLRAALEANAQASAASALVMGFGKTHAATLDTPPTLQVGSDISLALGQSVMLNASASDAEDGVLDAAIQWLDLASPHHAPVRGAGASFTFMPSSIGRHPIVIGVRDSAGLLTEKTLMVTVTGALPQAAPVQLTRDALTGVGITLSPDALSVSFNGTGKDGIRANQGIYTKFWYFEVHRNSPIRNMGIGLVTQDGALNPYEPARVPWSCSLNVMHGFWINLLEAGDWPDSDTDTDYGFAVDYRGEHPLVHILISGKLQTTLTLTDVWLPLYPLVYGNPPEAPLSGYDMTLNFGATPFAMDAKSVLTAAGVDATELEAGWGLSVAESK